MEKNKTKTGTDRRATPVTILNKTIGGALALLIGLTPGEVLALDPAPAPAASEAPAPQETAPQKFTLAELEALLAPIALYPDSLLAQLLPASAYPLDVVQAQRWLEKHKSAAAKNDFSAADRENWDPSVKALLRFPTVLQKMNDDLEWTENLGYAIVNQPQDVASVIQLLREKATKSGALVTTKEQRVVRQKQDGRDVVIIESQDPSVVYVPSYNPQTVYAPGINPAGAAIAGLLTFGVGVAVGSAISQPYWNWGAGAFYPPIWPGYAAWRPPYPGWRAGMPVVGGGGNNINIGNNVNIGNGSGNNLINNKPWRPDPGHYRPGGRVGAGGARPGAGRPGAIGGVGGGGGLNNGGINGRLPGGLTDRPVDKGPGRPGGGIGGGAGIGGGQGIGAAGRPNLARPATRPAVNPVQRPTARPTAHPMPARPMPARPGFGGGFNPAGGGHMARPAGGGFGGGHMARPAGGGFGGGRMARPAGGGFGGGGMHRGGGGGFRGRR